MNDRSAKFIYYFLARPIYLLAILFFGAFTIESLMRAWFSINETSLSGEEFGYLLGEEIGMVLLISLFSAIVITQCWKRFRRGPQAA